MSVSPCLRFSLTGHYPASFFIACSLEERWLCFWRRHELPGMYSDLILGNRDEQRAFWLLSSKENESESCTGWALSNEETAELSQLLSPEALETTRRYEDKQADYKFVMDGWALSFYAELSDGTPPVIVKRALEWPQENNEVFSQLYSWISEHFRILECDRTRFWQWNRRRPTAAERAHVQKALCDGIGAVKDLLCRGKTSQIKLIDELVHEYPLSYECDFPESFTLHMGQIVSRSFKLQKEPNCVRVFGEKHEFK